MYDYVYDNEPAFWAREVSSTLGISESTLRKYCLILEKAGYNFLRGDNGRRAFLERDITILKKFQELADRKSTTLEDAAATIVATVQNNKSSITPVDTNRSLSLETRIKPLLQPLLEQNETLKRELNEIRSQMAATHENLNEKLDTLITETRSERQRKARRWWRFWK
ncbi:hypothetical protein H1164_15670 [Thermoactinomyces daqus]|uniref:DUF3967 domain-containing protein n=1 Tax=Thermoactinomyces daqus TaxID=1329516 RepID=A0A7W2AJ00_9BACL|nr:hypothetical protein [Thermoactinomyces daqus]MBA4544291.1 hypothetical protein [Thermoactinomyces daqus]